MYRSRKFFALGGSAITASILAITVASSAAPATKTYKNVSTGFCLDSNTNRRVYTNACGPNNNFQKWR
ncbi:hypothetical protein ACKFKG_09475 [Phormidesmis sp. 146-35]